MEFINENNFDPTPKLKSSPVPILFLPFNNEKLRCNNCENKYSATNLYKQKYCKQCLSSYIENITDNNIYFNVNILTNNEHCIKHKSTRNLNFFTKNIQEWCENCSEISYFKNYYDYINTTTQYIFIEKDCKLCGKLIDKISFGFKMCSDCYLISSGWIKSTITGKNIPILYLPWWDTSNKSIFCKHNLKFMTDCQKWCSDCFIIYVGCRYCLTTNIIYGIIDQTQCIKCKRISNIKIEFKNISSGNHDIDEFLISTRTNTDCHDKIANYKNTMNKNSDPLSVYSFIERELKKVGSKRTMEWIPYSQIKNLEKIAEGGFGIIYKAIWLNKTTVAVKRFRKSQDISKYFLNFLNEVKSLHRCYDTVFIVKYYGITQDPVIKDYMLIMEYASGGNLHSYLNKNFINIKWITKLAILCQISDGLKTIHQENFIHRDFHSGNILSLKNDHKKWVIGDLGLSQPADNSSNNEIYGVIPYVAPEIFRGEVFSKESDIYSLGMIMWELTTGRKPFFNIEHDINLIYQIIDEKRPKRPEITTDAPKCFTNLMKQCWYSDPLKRPSITTIKSIVDDWYRKCKKDDDILAKADNKRLELIESKQIGPEFTEKQDISAIYTSQPLSSLISQVSSNNSSSRVSKQVCTSEECKFDTDNSHNTQRY
ncbi:Ssk22p [Rhizophagus irregularis DAOM 197198w]|uniref:Ssk22p n=1 Tax=Rhizophagus irregularis (strain DAOM 197198w) TaxID=1432141 RepID=A0A015K7J7_RHIIW|nr:Ssk22p [Rhizophagus irregularis DAOM 197198w]